MQSDEITHDIQEMKRLCEKYLRDRKGVDIGIVFPDRMKIHLHFKMLSEMYSQALIYYNKQK